MNIPITARLVPVVSSSVTGDGIVEVTTPGGAYQVSLGDNLTATDDPAKGAGVVGYSDGTAYAVGTVGQALADARVIAANASDRALAAEQLVASVSDITVPLSAASWAELAALTPTYIGQRATVSLSDTGTHTGRTAASPNTNVGSVPNSGIYGAYGTGVGQWRRDGDISATGLASPAQTIDGTASNIAVTPQGNKAALDVGLQPVNYADTLVTGPGSTPGSGRTANNTRGLVQTLAEMGMVGADGVLEAFRVDAGMLGNNTLWGFVTEKTGPLTYRVVAEAMGVLTATGEYSFDIGAFGLPGNKVQPNWSFAMYSTISGAQQGVQAGTTDTGWLFTGRLGSTASVVASSTSTPRISITVKHRSVSQKVATVESKQVATGAYLGGTPNIADVLVGYPLTGAQASAVGRTWFVKRPLEPTDVLHYLSVNATTAGGGSIVIARELSPTSFLPLAVYPVTLGSTGQQNVTVPDDPRFPGRVYGERVRVGFYGNPARLGYTGSQSPTGTADRFDSGAPVEGIAKPVSPRGEQPAIAYFATMVTNPLDPRLTKAESDILALQAGSGITVPAGKNPIFGPSNALRTWKAGLAKLRRGQSSVIRGVMLGSSSFNFRDLPQGLIDVLVREGFTLSSHGWLSFNTTGADRFTNGVTVAETGTWVLEDQIAGSTPCGLDGTALTSIVAGSSRTFANVLCDKVTIFSDNSTGTFEYQIDGGAWVQVVSAGTAGVRATTVNFTQGLHTIAVRSVGTALVRMLGIYADSATPGFQISKAGQGGATTASWTNVIAKVTPLLAYCDNLGFVVWALNNNDMRSGVSPTGDYKTRMEGLVDACITAKPDAGHILCPQHSIDTPDFAASAQYRDVIVAMANARPAATHFSMLDDLGTYAQIVANGESKDSLHLNENAGRHIGSALYRALLGVD